jgi:hypothetical protein
MKVKISTTISEETLKALRAYCEVTDVPMARVIERAVRDYLASKTKGE